MQNFTTLVQSFLGEKFVWVVGVWLRVNLVLRFGPNLCVGLLALSLDQAEQLICLQLFIVCKRTESVYFSHFPEEISAPKTWISLLFPAMNPCSLAYDIPIC